MREINGRFFRPRNTCNIDLSKGSLSLDNIIVVRKGEHAFEIPEAASLLEVFDLHYEDEAIEVRARLRKIAGLLAERRNFEAFLIASFTGWRLREQRCVRSGIYFEKYNFDPQEPRDNLGRWTREIFEIDDAKNIIDVAYPGTYHDQLLSDAVDYLRKKGSSVVTEVRLTGINGITARADAIVRPAGGDPYILEVKTGEDPPFTIQQDAVYPLVCTGPHAISPDPKISQIGYSAGDLLPQMDVWIVYSRGSGQRVSYFNGCLVPAIWRH